MKAFKHITPYPLLNTPHSIALIAHGAIHDYSLMRPLIQSYTKFVAIDGGLHHCHQMDIVPDLIIGDLDSVDPSLLSLYSTTPVLRFPTDKNETDTELAVRIVDNVNLNKIGLFGALEKRTDHTLSNLYLMSHFKKMIIETEIETLFWIEGSQEISCTQGQTVSFIPLGAAANQVTTKGLKWELNNTTLNSQFISLSNVCLSSRFYVLIGQGSLLCCLSRLQA